MLLVIISAEKLLKRSMKNKCKKKNKNQKEFRVEKVIKRKSDKLYVKWKGCYCSFNSWIDEKDIV